MSSNHFLRWLLIAITTALAQGQTYKCNQDNLLRNLQHNSAAAGIFCGGSPADFVPPLPTFLPSTSYPVQSLSSACYCFTNTLSLTTSSTTSSTSASSTSSATPSCQAPVTITSISTTTATVTSTLPDITLTSTITLMPAASTITDDITLPASTVTSDITLPASTTTLPASTITTTVSTTATPSYFSPYSGGGWISLNYPYVPPNVPLYAWELDYNPSDIAINPLLAQCIERYHAGAGITSNLIEANSYILALGDDNIFFCLIPWGMVTVEDLTVNNLVGISSVLNPYPNVVNAWCITNGMNEQIFTEFTGGVDDYTLPLTPPGSA